MIDFEDGTIFLHGPRGRLAISPRDAVALRLGMLFEGECEGQGAVASARKFGYSRQRYYQFLHAFEDGGVLALQDRKRGPRTNYRRTDEVIRQVIRHRFLDPDASAQVIAQKLNQAGWAISVRSVERIIAEFGLQKKTPYVPSGRLSP